MATIYVLVDGRTGEVRYVGQTRIELALRLARHWVTAMAGAHEHRAAWMRSVKAAGGDVVIRAIESCNPDTIDDAEMSHIARYLSLGCDLTNRTAGGRGKRAWVASAETRLKMSESASRRRVSPETRAKMGAAIRASERHKRHRERLHRLNRRPCKAETKRSISDALRGDSNPNKVLSMAVAAEIRSSYDAGVRQCDLARDYQCSAATIHAVVRRQRWMA